VTLDVDLVRRAFYRELNTRADASPWAWAWIHKIYRDPDELIVDRDDGTLYRVPFTVSGDQATFGEAQEVKVEYVDVTCSVPASA
jgi:hypothetical protein